MLGLLLYSLSLLSPSPSLSLSLYIYISQFSTEALQQCSSLVNFMGIEIPVVENQLAGGGGGGGGGG